MKAFNSLYKEIKLNKRKYTPFKYEIGTRTDSMYIYLNKSSLLYR